MIKILTVCLGNICRSPMAEFVLKDLVKKLDIEDRFLIESCGTSDEEYGNPVYPPVKMLLNAKGIDCSKKRARQIKAQDLIEFDYILVMEQYHLDTIAFRFGKDKAKNVKRILDYTKTPHDIADPWYTRDFNLSYEEIKEGAIAFLKSLKELNLDESQIKLLDELKTM